MKVKLLKIVRKRYSIVHYPNGVYMGDTFWEGPVTCLIDNSNSWRLKASFSTKKKAFTDLIQHMKHWIEQDYGVSKGKQKKLTSETLWYKK